MTSTTLSSKGYCVTQKEFGVLFKWALKRNRVLMIVHTIILAVIGPVFNLYCASISGRNSDEVGAVSLMLFVSLAALFTFISAIKTFSFLHNKRSVDLYGAMPCNRITMFLSHLTAGITSVTVPYVVASVITIGISARLSDAITFGLNSILFTVLMIIASYTFTALMAYCCGTVVDTIIVTFAVNVIWVSAIALYYAFLSELIPGASFDSIITTPILSAFAPYTFGYMGVYAHYTDSALMYVGTLIWFIFYTVLVFVATVILANKRKAESSQNGFAVKWLPMFIKAGASVISGALIGYIFAELSSSGMGNMFIYCFWYVLIGAVAFFVLHIIFARGLKGNYLKSIIVYLAATFASIMLVFAMCFGMGIDTYVPNPNSVKSVIIDYGDISYTDPESIRLVTEIHEVIVEGIRNNYDYPYYFGYYFPDDFTDEYYDTYEESTVLADTYTSDEDKLINLDDSYKYSYINGFDFSFSYKMKNGTKVVRSYYISSYDTEYDRDKLNELCKQFISTDEYKKKNAEFLFDENKRNEYGAIESVSINHYSLSDTYDSYNYDANATLPTDEKFLNGLYAALQKDILADKNYIPKSYYDLRFYNELGKGYSKLEVQAYSKAKNKESTQNQVTFSAPTVLSVIVKDSYTNTKKYLNDNNIVFSDIYSYNGIYNSMFGGDYEYSSDYFNWIMEDYNSFIKTGEYSYLYDVVGSCYDLWANSACVQLGEDDYYWYEFYDELEEAVRTKTSELYNQMQKENGCDGTQDDVYCPTGDEAQELISQIESYVYNFIAQKLGKELPDTDISSDTDKGSGTDSDKLPDTDTSESKTVSDGNTNSSNSGSKSDSTSSKSDNSSSKAESKLESVSENGIAA